MSEHGPDVCFIADSGGCGERNSSDGLDIEKVDGVHISPLGQPGGHDVCTLDDFLAIGCCRLAWDFLFFPFLVGDSLIDLKICNLLLAIRGRIRWVIV